MAWDCATGNGQAAIALSHYFEKVLATDASANQIKYAQPKSNIEYRVAGAENSGIESQTVDLVTVAQALHWFDGPEFYEEVKRVASRSCVFAAWGYSVLRIGPVIDIAIDKIYEEVVGEFWTPERRQVELRYDTLSIPFGPIESHQFQIKDNWNLSTLCSYIMTWSSSQRYLKARRESPIDPVWTELKEAWGPPEGLRQINFPVFLKICAVS